MAVAQSVLWEVVGMNWAAPHTLHCIPSKGWDKKDQTVTQARQKCRETSVSEAISDSCHGNVSKDRSSRREGEKGEWRGQVHSSVRDATPADMIGKEGFQLESSTPRVDTGQRVPSAGPYNLWFLCPADHHGPSA